MQDYIWDRAKKLTAAYDKHQPGNPEKGVRIVLDIIRGEGLARGKAFPISLQLGSDCYKMVKERSEETLLNLAEWKEVSESTDF